MSHQSSSELTTMAANSNSSTSAVEDMFKQIMAAVQKSQTEIADLRQECTDLKNANANIERQIREQLNFYSYSYGSRVATPGFMTPAPSSPQLRPKTPFLRADSLPPLSTPIHAPSRLGEYALTSFQYGHREIPCFHVVIPAGGAGTRLWPLSREGHPKFLLDLTLGGRSLIQATWDRLIPLCSAARTCVVAGPAHIKDIQKQLPELYPGNLLCEPGPKESMGAIGLAAAVIFQRDPEAVIGSFPADHMISGDEAFLSAVAEAVEVAKKGYLVTIGIAPSHPSTGFGYIRLGEKLNLTEAPNARIVSSFKEKPDARTAASYIATGAYRWNAGMFVSKASVLLKLLQGYQPALYDGLMKIGECWENESTRQQVLDTIWPTLDKIPIDTAIAEPAALEGKVAVVPATFGWDDVGDFSSLSDLLPAEANQPRILGDSSFVLTEQVAGGIVVPVSGRRIACLGVDDLVIVDMPDTLLVTTRARSQEVKRLVKKCRDAGWKDLL